MKRGSPDVFFNVEKDGRSTLMEVDTGSSVSVIALGTLDKKLPVHYTAVHASLAAHTESVAFF